MEEAPLEEGPEHARSSCPTVPQQMVGSDVLPCPRAGTPLSFLPWPFCSGFISGGCSGPGLSPFHFPQTYSCSWLRGSILGRVPAWGPQPRSSSASILPQHPSLRAAAVPAWPRWDPPAASSVCPTQPVPRLLLNIDWCQPCRRVAWGG